MQMTTHSVGQLASTGDTVRLRDVWAILVRHWILLSSLTAAGTIAGVAAAFLMTPVYRAEIVVMPASEEDLGGTLSRLSSQFGALASLVGPGLETGGSREEALGILRSRAFTGAFIEDEDLLPVLFADMWDAAGERWLVEDDGSLPSPADGIRLFDEKIRGISMNNQTGLLTLSIEWTDRELAARWANTLIERVNRQMQERVVSEAKQSLAYLDRELNDANILELRDAIYRLTETQIKRIMMANVRDQYAFKIIDPAAVPEPDDFVRPKRLMLIVSGFILGAIAGCIAAIGLAAFGAGRVRAGGAS